MRIDSLYPFRARGGGKLTLVLEPGFAFQHKYSFLSVCHNPQTRQHHTNLLLTTPQSASIETLHINIPPLHAVKTTYNKRFRDDSGASWFYLWSFCRFIKLLSGDIANIPLICSSICCILKIENGKINIFVKYGQIQVFLSPPPPINANVTFK